jgi:multidrug efflux pump subunit AcrB
VSWLVAVVFTPYLGVKLLPAIKPLKGGHAALYATPGYEQFRRLVRWSVAHKSVVVGAVVGAFVFAVFGMGFVNQQFSRAPSDRR